MPGDEMVEKADSALLVTHVALREGQNGLEIDEQSAAGIAQWCKHFKQISYYGVLSPAGGEGASSNAWTNMEALVAEGRVELRALPWAYRPTDMARHVGAVRNELREAITQHQHLCFTLGSILGDWPSLGAIEAIRQKRRYAAWIDRVEPAIIRAKLVGSPVERVAAEAILPVTQGVIRYILRKSAVALLQGGDSFDFYARSAPAPHCTYDTHTQRTDEISLDELTRKQTRILSGAPLKIVYVGRVAAMKGPRDWLSTLVTLHRKGIAFDACWIGDGPDLPAMRKEVCQRRSDSRPSGRSKSRPL
ncbi:hypothetical protein HHL08_11140 [Sphingobium sp. AR-3-1]|uniref:Glycosyltransferase n=1 Tax=Sphingobium psychrophilum TaxID=2728834 RepID=A0A7X9WVJ7_9SPHN|nr:hypothetical protein [Sphingobium psychrophilum]NML10697.1 hypothetical protein [Sphingobium psychrophilum]